MCTSSLRRTCDQASTKRQWIWSAQINLKEATGVSAASKKKSIRPSRSPWPQEVFATCRLIDLYLHLTPHIELQVIGVYLVPAGSSHPQAHTDNLFLLKAAAQRFVSSPLGPKILIGSLSCYKSEKYDVLRSLFRDGWVDIGARFADPPEPTACHGTRIDSLLANPLASLFITGFHVQNTTGYATHFPIVADFEVDDRTETALH